MAKRKIPRRRYNGRDPVHPKMTPEQRALVAAEVKDFRFLNDRDRFPAFYKLKWSQRAFVINYCKCRNATVAYIEAGYRQTPNSDKLASRLKTSAPVAAALDEISDHLGLTPRVIVDELGEIAKGIDLADLEPYLDGENTLRGLREEGVNTKLLTKARQTKEKDGSEHRQLEVIDRLAALKVLAKIRGMVTEKHEHKITGTLDLTEMSDEELERLEHTLRVKTEKQEAEGD